MLDELSLLAQETSSDKRRELMGKLADIFVADSEIYSDRELFLFGEILTNLLDDADVQTKVSLSESVAPVKNTPRDLALALANQEIDVAMPVLERSPVLTDQDLVEIAATKTTDHRLAISQRFNLNIVVTDALISHGEHPVLRSVCQNASADISETGFHALVDSAETDKETRDLLSHRLDMPAKIVERVLPLLSETAQARLKDISQQGDSSRIVDILAEAEQRSKEAADNAKWKQIQSKALLDDILNGEKELAPSIEGLCNIDRPLDVAFVLAGYAGIPEQQVLAALLNKKGQAIVVLCRALDFPDHTFSALVDMRGKRLNLPPETSERMMRDFAALDAAAAKRTMRFIKVRQAAK